MLYAIAKSLEGVGMVIVLVGVLWSISEGFQDESLASMAVEMKGLLFGGALFVAGILIERRIGTR